MKVKELFNGTYQIVAVMDGDVCPTEDFLLNGEATTQSNRDGLLTMMEHIAEQGFHNLPAKWTHEASKKDGIQELIKGRLRVFFFKGEGKQIVVCTHGTMKKTPKADSAEVAKAKAGKDGYEAAVKSKQLEVVSDED